MPPDPDTSPKKYQFGGPARGPVVPNPFMRKSLAWILAANSLRPKPLPYTKLSHYTGHSSKSFARAFNTLISRGLFDANGKLDTSSAQYRQLKPAPIPLPDLAAAVSLVGPSSEPAAPQHRAPEPPDVNNISPERAIAILSRWVESGAAGKDAPKFIAQIMELRRLTGKSAGPPAPRSDNEVLIRLVAILDSVPPALLAIALERLHDIQRLRTPPPSEAQASDSLPDPPSPSGGSGPEQTTSDPEPDPRGLDGDPSPRTPPLGASS